MLRQSTAASCVSSSLIGVVLSLGFISHAVGPPYAAILTLPSRVALLVWIALGVVFYVVSADVQKLSDRELSGLIWVRSSRQ